MSVQTRGGIPRIFQGIQVPTTGLAPDGAWTFGGTSMRLRIRVTTFPVRIYFSQSDFDNDVDYWEIAAGTEFDAQIEERCVWMRGVGGTASADLLVLYRKG